MRRTHRVATAVVTMVSGAIFLTPSAAVAARSWCSVKHLHYSYLKGTASYSDAVEKLTTTAASCTSAQKVVGAIAKDLLHTAKVPGKVDGWKVKVTNPCASCTPLWSGTATGPGATVTFTVMGGAK